MAAMEPVMIHVGWRSRTTGELCDCPAYELSPHTHHDRVEIPADVLAQATATR